MQTFPFRKNSTAAIIALGGELKGSLCVLTDGVATLDDSFGDLRMGKNYRQFAAAATAAAQVGTGQIIIAHDMHPLYLSTQLASKMRGDLAGDGKNVKLLAVQHHHAHALSCLADNNFDSPAVAVVCDGTGYGTDSASWGCEILLCCPEKFERLGHLRYIPLPGGDIAATEIWRTAMAWALDAAGDGAMACKAITNLATDSLRKNIRQMIAVGANCPLSGSLGRLFDAAAALAGMASENTSQAYGPMLLEKSCDDCEPGLYDFEITPGQPFVIDPRPMIRGIIADVEQNVAAGTIAAKFHNTVAEFLHQSAIDACGQCNINAVAISGGCFANQRLAKSLQSLLEKDGVKVLTHKSAPVGDGGLALGQAIAAAAIA